MVPRNNRILFTARKLKETNKHENRKSTQDLFRKLHDFSKELASIKSPLKPMYLATILKALACPNKEFRLLGAK